MYAYIAYISKRCKSLYHLPFYNQICEVSYKKKTEKTKQASEG